MTTSKNMRSMALRQKRIEIERQRFARLLGLMPAQPQIGIDNLCCRTVPAAAHLLVDECTYLRIERYGPGRRSPAALLPV